MAILTRITAPIRNRATKSGASNVKRFLWIGLLLGGVYYFIFR